MFECEFSVVGRVLHLISCQKVMRWKSRFGDMSLD